MIEKLEVFPLELRPDSILLYYIVTLEMMQMNL